MMTKEEKTNYLRIALALQGIASNNELCGQLIETYEKILELGGDFSLKDAAEIQRNFLEQKLEADREKKLSTGSVGFVAIAEAEAKP